MRQILVAVDVSPLGASVIEEAPPLARRLGGAVLILHVCSIEGYTVGPASSGSCWGASPHRY